MNYKYKSKYYGNSKSKIQSILGARNGRHIVLLPHSPALPALDQHRLSCLSGRVERQEVGYHCF